MTPAWGSSSENDRRSEPSSGIGSSELFVRHFGVTSTPCQPSTSSFNSSNRLGRMRIWAMLRRSYGQQLASPARRFVDDLRMRMTERSGNVVVGRIARVPRGAAITLVRGYQYFLSPFFGQHCRFHPTCSSYAIEALRRFGLLRGGWLAVRRLARCQPWCQGGIDPVPMAAAPDARQRACDVDPTRC